MVSGSAPRLLASPGPRWLRRGYCRSDPILRSLTGEDVEVFTLKLRARISTSRPYREPAGASLALRDIASRLRTSLVFLPVADQISSGTYLLYDGACGTGGMLTVAEETLQQLAAERGKRVATHLYGQEINAETYAICKADLVLKGGRRRPQHRGRPERAALSQRCIPGAQDRPHAVLRVLRSTATPTVARSWCLPTASWRRSRRFGRATNSRRARPLKHLRPTSVRRLTPSRLIVYGHRFSPVTVGTPGGPRCWQLRERFMVIKYRFVRVDTS